MEPVPAATAPASAKAVAGDYTVGEIVSRVTAMIAGGGVLTYWLGAVVAKAVVLTGLMVPNEAAYFTGMAQVALFAGIVVLICATASQVRVWIGLAAAIGLSVALALLTPALPTPAKASSAAGTLAAQALRP